MGSLQLTFLAVGIFFGFFSPIFSSPFEKDWPIKRFRIDPFAEKDQIRESKSNLQRFLKPSTFLDLSINVKFHNLKILGEGMKWF